jgi:hypothetical protein
VLSAEKPTGAVLVHAIGGGDLGCPGARDWDGLFPRLDDDPGATGKQRRPLRKLLEGLRAARRPVSVVVLLGTTVPPGPGDRSFAEWADEVRKRLVSEAGLYGMRFDPAAVFVVRVEALTMRSASAALRRWFAAHPCEQVLISCGSGAYTLSSGALCAAIEAHRPAEIVHIDAPATPHLVDRRSLGRGGADGHLQAWLVRHRFWDAMAEVDPDHGLTWRLLAARQAGDVELARSLQGESADTGGSAMRKGRLDKLAAPWPTAQAALFERVSRGEAADHGLFRAWFTHHLATLFGKDQDDLDPATRSTVARLIDDLSDRNEGRGRLSGRIRATAREVADVGVGTATVRMLRDQPLLDLYTASANHAYLSGVAGRTDPEPGRPSGAAMSGPLPRTLVTEAHRWESVDLGVALVAETGKTAWPVLGSGDVLGMVAVGLPREGRDADDYLALAAVLATLRQRQRTLPHAGSVRLRLVASPQARDRAEALAAWAREHQAGADVAVIGGVSGDLAQVRDAIIAALHGEPTPTGRTGSGSLRDVDEVVLVLNPGPPMTNYGMIAAAVEWSLTAACPLEVTELARNDRGTPTVLGGRPLFARLGADELLAHLASSAVRHLDLRTARRLVERGSGRLRSVLPGLDRLESELYGPAPAAAGAGHGERGSRAAARQRLLLVAETCRAYQGLAAYLAVSALRPGLYTWQAWKGLCASHSSLGRLAGRANLAVQGHALDRERARRVESGPRRRRSPGASGHHEDVRTLLLAAVRELGGPAKGDTALIYRHKTLMEALEAVNRESG